MLSGRRLHWRGEAALRSMPWAHSAPAIAPALLHGPVHPAHCPRAGARRGAPVQGTPPAWRAAAQQHACKHIGTGGPRPEARKGATPNAASATRTGPTAYTWPRCRQRRQQCNSTLSPRARHGRWMVQMDVGPLQKHAHRPADCVYAAYAWYGFYACSPPIGLHEFVWVAGHVCMTEKFPIGVTVVIVVVFQSLSSEHGCYH